LCNFFGTAGIVENEFVLFAQPPILENFASFRVAAKAQPYRLEADTERISRRPDRH